MTTSSISVAVTNQLGGELTVYTTTSKPVSNPPSTNPADYYPIYTKLGTVPANGTNTLDTGTILSRLVITRSTDEFPVKLFVPDILGAPTQPVTVAAADQTATETALAFYKQYKSQPYSPVALQFTALVLDAVNATTLDTHVSALLASNGFAGADYFGFSMVSYWAANALAAWPGTYYCYEPPPSGDGFILPTTAVGQIAIGAGTAGFMAADGGTSVPSLIYNDGVLTSPGGSSTQGIKVTAVLRDLTWEGQPDQISMFWVGTRDGTQFVVQPYETPALPWWVAAYNLSFATFLTIQIVMTLDMAAHVLQGIASGAQWLASNAQTLYQSIRSRFEDASAEADADAVAGDDIEAINVDVDVDVDVDIDIDVVTDTDNVTDTDVDVDIDIDIDIDDDVFAIIDVDVDIDIDIDTDVVTDTDNVTDTDTDTDTDVDADTDVDVPPGGIKSLLSKVGNWIMTKGLPALVKNAVIMGAMMGAQKLLEVWKDHDELSLQSMSPQESTGLGLLLNYMLNPANAVSVRWTTFADYVQTGQPDAASQQLLLASILMFKNVPADTDQSNWKWPKATKDALVSQMAQYSAPAAQYQAYLLLAGYAYQGNPLPVKVGAGVAQAYLNAIG